MVELEQDIETISRWIENNGSVLASASTSLGGHAIVIDAINHEKATIRDPAHGWRVTISTKQLLSMAPIFKGIRLR